LNQRALESWPILLPGTWATEAADAAVGMREEARRRAEMAGIPFVPRAGRSLAELFAATGCAYLAVWPQNGLPTLHRRGGGRPLVYHPGLSLVRVKHVLAGGRDKLLDFAEVTPGDIVLDGTAGLGADAAVLAFAAGPSGLVLACEKSSLVAFALREGLGVYRSGVPAFDEAIRRVEVRCGRFQEVLAGCLDPFDVIYLDPMFERTVETSPGMEALRPFADASPLVPADLAAARRRAKRWVVVKGRRHSGIWRELGAPEVDPGSGTTAYGRWPGMAGEQVVRHT
jgi:16S rRNA (guanine1516-N2)-methyltransferase